MSMLNNFHWSLWTGFDYLTVIVNIIMFIFANKLIIKSDTQGNLVKDYSKKVYLLRLVNFVFFCVHIITFVFDRTIGENWIQSYLLILSFFVFTHWINHFLLVKYGDKEKVDDVMRITDNYLSQILRVSITVSSIFIVSFSLIQIWNLKSLLESGSVLVTLGFIIFATKDYWLEEVLASFTIHAKGKLKRGTVIMLDEQCYVILETNFIGSRLKNLKTEIELTIPNSRFVREKIKILSREKDTEEKNKKSWKPFKNYIHFKIGYESEFEEVKSYFDSVFQDATKECSYIKSNYTLNINENSDHAVVWEVVYYIDNPYGVLNAKNIINMLAFKKQKEFNIDLSTPIKYKKL